MPSMKTASIAILVSSLCIRLVGANRQSHLEPDKREDTFVIDSVPPHLSKYAASGKDIQSYISNAEKNKLLGSAFLEAKKRSDPVGQEVFPKQWRDRLSQEVKLIGQGAFGKVYLTDVVCDSTPQQVAIKVQLFNKKSEDEAKLMESLDHPNLLKAFEYAEGPTFNDLSLLMESAAGGDFSKVVGLPLAEQARLLMEVFNGLAYMHEQGLVHADVKDQNILLSSDCGRSTCHAKLGDLGVTVKSGTPGLEGSPLFMAPENLLTGIHSKSNDIWSMGILAYAIFKGSLPFDLLAVSHDVALCIERIKSITSAYVRSSGEDSVSFVEDLLEGLLNPNPQHRITASDAAALCERFWRLYAGSFAEDNVALPSLPSCWASCGARGCSATDQTCRLDERSDPICEGGFPGDATKEG